MTARTATGLPPCRRSPSSRSKHTSGALTRGGRLDQLGRPLSPQLRRAYCRLNPRSALLSCEALLSCGLPSYSCRLHGPPEVRTNPLLTKLDPDTPSVFDTDWHTIRIVEPVSPIDPGSAERVVPEVPSLEAVTYSEGVWYAAQRPVLRHPDLPAPRR